MAVIGVCDSGQESSIKSLLHELRDLSSRSGGEVRFIQLPYSDLDSFELARGIVDGIILCHSIHNRRFSITDVDDALYDKFLPRMAETFCFRIKQPATFECSKLAITCGRLDSTLEIDIEDRENLAVFLQNVQLRTREPRKRKSLLEVLFLGGVGALFLAASYILCTRILYKLKTFFFEEIVPRWSRLINTPVLICNISSLLDCS
ncbi:uncharacterized protein [Diadema antillarum]|uniref:uncharacterized protein n=1 Tax=Diadema antillarum TaxID=105358 RepID=UPI003A8A1C30